MPRFPRFVSPVAVLFTTAFVLSLLSLPSHAEQIDARQVWRGGPPRDGMLISNRISVRFAPGAVPQVSRRGNAGLVTDRSSWNTLAQSFDLRDLYALFPSTQVAGKRLTADEEEMSHWYTVTFDGEQHQLQDVLTAVKSLPGVVDAIPVPIAVLDAVVPNDPQFASQIWLRNLNPGGRDIRAMAAWAHETGDSNVVVAIADSGVDWKHPDLGGTAPDYIDGNIWINWTEYNGTPGFDDDGNGYIDDIRGWDFVTGVSGNQNPPQDVLGEDNDPMDYGGHGTAVAGCVAAIGNNATGVVGVAFTCKVMALRIGWTPANSDLGVVGMDFAASAMNYARIKGAKVYNASWGSSAYIPLVSAVNAAINAGMTIVTAAGNDNTEVASYLAGRSDVLAVAATTSSDAKTSFSSFGTWVDVSAPGENIYTTMFNNTGSGNAAHTYGTISGTSFSSPITAGMAAIVYSANPGISGAAVRAAVKAAVDPIDSVNQAVYAGKLGTGRINVFKLFGSGRLKVPEEAPDIATAVATLILDPGSEIACLGGITIQENLHMTEDAGLQINGGYDATYTTRDPIGNRTILQGDGLKPVVRIRTGISVNTVLDGFQITGGKAEQVPLAPDTGFFGGGVRIENSSVTLRNLLIDGNTAGGSTDISGGGGVAILSSDPVLDNVEITGNTGLRGAGLYIYNSTPQITGLNVHDNISWTGPVGTPPDGGGVYVVDSPTAAGTATFSNSTISGHSVAGLGGGLYAINSDLVLQAVTIQGNTATSGGGGFWASGGSITANNLQVIGNVVDGTNKNGGGALIDGTIFDQDGGVYQGNNCTFFGGAISANNSAGFTLRNTFLTGNSAATIGSAAYISSSTGCIFENNTIADNDGASFGANGIYLVSSDAGLARNIFAFNGGTGTTNADGVTCASSTSTFSCNLFYQNALGNTSGCGTDPVGTGGNVSADPQFCDRTAGDYSIPPSSPAAGANSGGCGTLGADAETCLPTAVESPTPGRPQAFALYQNHPNPFNPVTTISFALPRDGATTVTIYDARGRRVATLLDAPLQAGIHQVNWNGRDARGAPVASGVYLYEVRSGEWRAVRKMGLIK